MLNALKFTSNYPKATNVLNQFKKYVLQQAKSNLSKEGHKASGKLYNSLKGDVKKTANRGLKGRFTGGSSMPSLDFEMEHYGKFIDLGVKGSRSSYITNALSPFKFGRGSDKKAVPVQPIKAWCRKKGLPVKASYAIAKSIYQKGIERSMFFSKPFNKRYKSTVKAYHVAIADDMATNIANQLAKRIKQKTK
jgi:hypothetical protein